MLTPGVVGRATGGGQAYAQSNSDLYNNEFGVNMNAERGARASRTTSWSAPRRSARASAAASSTSIPTARACRKSDLGEQLLGRDGRNGSILVNVITKSGSNAFSGSLGTYYTNNSLQSKNYFQKQTTGFSHPDYGRTELSWGLGGGRFSATGRSSSRPATSCGRMLPSAAPGRFSRRPSGSWSRRGPAMCRPTSQRTIRRLSRRIATSGRRASI